MYTALRLMHDAVQSLRHERAVTLALVGVVPVNGASLHGLSIANREQQTNEN